MNDFTKEELEYLFRKFMLTNGDDFEHNLEAKLRSKIDSYCEHIWTDGSGNMIFCSKCQVYGGKR
jgi:hypothetical protein